MSVRAFVPMIYVASVPRSIAFYRILGFVETNAHTPEGAIEPVWAWLRSGDAQLMLARGTAPVDPEKPAGLFYAYCDDVDAFRTMVVEAGIDAGSIARPFYAPRGEFRIVDPDGHVVMISHT